MKQHLYYETLGWESYWKNFFRQDKNGLLEALRKDFGSTNVFLTRCGRTGIVLSLKAFGLRRDDEVLIPRFMSTCVLDSVNQVALPSLNLTDRTKAVLLHHHWGYPQNYEKARAIISAKELHVIEDCAHGLWGKSQGIMMGAFGHTAIFSLAKTFEHTYAGAVRVNDQVLSSRIEGMLFSKISLRDRWESLQGEWEYLKFYNTPLDQRSSIDVQVGLSKWYAALLAYPGLTTLRGEVPRSREELQAVFTRQNKNFLFLLNNAAHRPFMISGDEDATMAPLCFPVISDDEKLLNQIKVWLKQRNIYTGIYHFDINRCMFEPNYKKCVPIPLYASLPEQLYVDFVQEFNGRF